MNDHEEPRPIPTLAEYAGAWAREHINTDFESPSVRTRYLANQAVALDTMRQHPFYLGMRSIINEMVIKYAESGFQMLMEAAPFNGVELEKKPYDSLINKTYRLNCLHNRDYPNAPVDAWCDESNWFGRLKDVIRGRIVCKYLDATFELEEALRTHALATGLVPLSRPQNSDEGYYAIHFYTSMPVELLTATAEAVNVGVSLEIQITTQLHEVLDKVTHKPYEQRRLMAVRDQSWKWDPKSPLFKLNYIGHTLHFLDGLIVEVKQAAQEPAVKQLEAERNDHVE